MSAALLLTVAMTGSHNCCCPTYSSYYYSAPYSDSYSAPYSYSYAQPYAYSNYNYYPSRNDAYRNYSYRSDAYRSPRRNGAGDSGYQERRAGFTPQPDSQMAVVQMTDRARFEPAQITVNVGETVEWRNVSRHPHTVTANPELAKNPAHVILPEGAELFDSGEIAPGARFSHKFTVPGTYYYVCQPHEEMGMVGIVVVKQPKGSQPNEAAPGSEKGQTGGRTY